jgi:hypothetical protein
MLCKKPRDRGQDQGWMCRDTSRKDTSRKDISRKGSKEMAFKTGGRENRCDGPEGVFGTEAAHRSKSLQGLVRGSLLCSDGACLPQYKGARGQKIGPIQATFPARARRRPFITLYIYYFKYFTDHLESE